MNTWLLFLALVCSLVVPISCWDSDDLEIFDLVEEVNQNFYNALNITEDVDAAAIRKAFRQLSLQLHPDKNPSPNADVEFRQLVAMYDVLKDPKKREKYNLVLKNGLPNWKSAVYYYRHVRKMGLIEMFVILFIVITIGQYVVAWASYVEQKFNLEEQYRVKIKKIQKRAKTSVNLDEIYEELERPSVRNTLPFQIPWLVWTIVINLPSSVMAIRNYFEERKRRKLQELEEEKRRIEEEEKELARKEQEPAPKKKRKPAFVPKERDYNDDETMSPIYNTNRMHDSSDENTVPIITGGFWSDDDLVELVRLIKKHPQGTAQRWEKIARAMNRHVAEVTHMAAKMKDNCYKVPEPETDAYQVVEPVKKQKTKGGKHGEADSSENSDQNWTEHEQKALENALTKYPKGSVDDRWEKIANCVPGKTKDACILRYKYLVELVKQKAKSNKSEASGDTGDTQKQVPTSNTE